MSDLKIEANRITLDSKEIDKRVSKKIETSNPYVSRASKGLEKLEQGPTDEMSLSFNGVRVGHGSKAVTDPQFYLDEKPQTAERARKSRAHRMSIQMESEKSEMKRNEYLKSLLNDEV